MFLWRIQVGRLPLGNFDASKLQNPACLLQGKTSQLPIAVLAEEHLGQIRKLQTSDCDWSEDIMQDDVAGCSVISVQDVTGGLSTFCTSLVFLIVSLQL